MYLAVRLAVVQSAAVRAGENEGRTSPSWSTRWSASRDLLQERQRKQPLWYTCSTTTPSAPSVPPPPPPKDHTPFPQALVVPLQSRHSCCRLRTCAKNPRSVEVRGKENAQLTLARRRTVAFEKASRLGEKHCVVYQGERRLSSRWRRNKES